MALTLFQLKNYKTGHTIIKSVEPYIHKVPIARQLTNLYWLARCQQFSDNTNEAIKTTHQAIHLSKQFDMLGWSVKFHSLLSSLSDDPKHYESWMQIFNQRTRDLLLKQKDYSCLITFNLCTINKSTACPILHLEDYWEHRICLKFFRRTKMGVIMP